MTEPVHDFLVDRADLRRTRLRSAALPALADGDVLLAVDRFALTANNVTYAAFGDAMSYWDFFPTGEDGWGRVPVWGFATVLRSSVDGIAPGERFYGYYPMASHLVVRPERVGNSGFDSGFNDGSAHRAKLHALYNRYVRTTTDALYDANREALTMLLRPLFVTSFVIDDFLADNAFFGAQAVLLSSASSKTTFGTAWQLSLRRPGGPEVIGLTSRGNAAFVQSLGVYDRVVTYDAVASLPADRPVVYVDLAGDRGLRAALHARFGDAMRYSCVVGSSHWDAAPVADARAPLPGAKPTFFFAPTQIAKRTGEWGADGFQQRFAAAWHAFTDRVIDAERPWMTVVEEHGAEAVERVYRALVDGRGAPDEGHVVSLSAG